jgi:hypothetical protein
MAIVGVVARAFDEPAAVGAQQVACHDVNDRTPLPSSW